MKRIKLSNIVDQLKTLIFKPKATTLLSQLKTFINKLTYRIIIFIVSLMPVKISYDLYNLINNRYSWINIVFDLTKCTYYNEKLKAYMRFIDRSSAETLLDNYESEVFSFFIPQPNDVVIDVGANIGYFTIYASRKIGKDGLVIALEPMDEAYDCLIKNLRLNRIDNVKPFKLALWSSETTLRLYRTKGYFTSAISKVDVLKKLIQQKKLKLIKEYEIKTIKLDDLIKNINLSKVDWIKIDVDGSEYEVILGSMKTLKLFKPKLIIEIPDQEIGNKIQKILKDLGYKISLVKIWDNYHIFAEHESC
jgi:FkbM family methyltransferase